MIDCRDVAAGSLLVQKLDTERFSRTQVLSKMRRFALCGTNAFLPSASSATDSSKCHTKRTQNGDFGGISVTGLV